MPTDLPGASVSWDIGSNVDQLLAYHFMVNALVAGAIVAVLAGSLGWFMVLRGQTFAGHALAVIAFPGAAGAVLAGLPVALGYFGFCGAGAVALAGAGPAAQGPGSESASIGALQALGLGLGFLFVSLYGGVLNGTTALLFGTFLGIDDGQVRTLAGVALLALVLLAAIGRPLLFASVDPRAAEAVGVPVRALSLGFLMLLGLAVAATSQITGALLVFSLLVTPAATSQTITARPWFGLGLSVAIAVAVIWSGLAVAYFSPYPVGFWVTTISFALYVAARVVRGAGGRPGHSVRQEQPRA